MHEQLALIYHQPSDQERYDSDEGMACTQCFWSCSGMMHVYLMPERTPCSDTLEAIAAEVRAGGGTALESRFDEPNGANFFHLFERSEGFALLLANLAMMHDALITCELQKSLKQARKPRNTFTSFSEIDFFLGKTKEQTGATLQGLDNGGVQPPEGIGVESVLAGLRDAIHDDDQLLTSVSGVFDGLITAFGTGVPTYEPT